MAADPGSTAAAPRSSTVGSSAMCAAGWFVGYLISSASSLALFLVTGIAPHRPASAVTIALVALYGIAFAVLAGWVGACFRRQSAFGIGIAIGLTIVLAGLVSWISTPTHAHWSQMVAIVLMAPAAAIGGRLRRLNQD